MTEFSWTVKSGVYHFVWPSSCMRAEHYRAILAHVKESRDYAPLEVHGVCTPREHTFCAFVREHCIDPSQAVAVRNIALKAKIIKNHHRMNKLIARIYREYADGADIVSISSKWDFPPMNLLRGILLHRGDSPKRLYDVFANRNDPAQVLRGRDLEQYHIAAAADAESVINQQQAARVAADNEREFVEFFRSIGCKLKTQDDLTAEQTRAQGVPMLTPDLLFLSEVYINNIRVHWIDYKDYICTRVHFLWESNAKQAAKYNAKWGPGALCFHRSYVEGVEIPHAQLLDARVLPITLTAWGEPTNARAGAKTEAK